VASVHSGVEESDIDDDVVLEGDNDSQSTDDTWTPSVDGEDSDEEDMTDDGTLWQETPIKFQDFSVNFNKVDTELERGYFEEVKELRKRVNREFNSIASINSKEKSTLTANEVFNAIYNTDILFSVLTFQNKSLVANKKKAMDFKEFEVFLRCFFGLCFYGCSLSDVQKHPQAYPVIWSSLMSLSSRLSGTENKIARMNVLLRSFDGYVESNSPRRTEDQEGGVFWSPIYGIDRELEKLFRDVGGRTSHIAFVDGYTDLIIDDEKLRMRSTKANQHSLSRMMSAKSFGPVGNCINSIATGISLSCHMNHHGESSKDIITSGLMIIQGINNPNSLHFPMTTIHGDRGYNDDECFHLIEGASMGFLNTVKRGPSLAFKFGLTRYNTNREQREISENGPVLSLGAVRSVGSAVCHFVAYRNGTGRVTFLQSTSPSLSYGSFDYITTQKELRYAKVYKSILQKEKHKEEDYEAEEYLTLRECQIREIFDRHCVYLACKGQGGDEWRYMRSFTITSTLCHAILPRTEDGLSENEIDLLRNNLGVNVKSQHDAEVDDSWQHKTMTELKALSNDQLKAICKSYGRPFSNKNKEKLAETVQMGPQLSQSITEVEKIIKYSFLQPLGQEDRSAHKLGSLNEEKVRSVLHAIVAKVGWELVDSFECGLLRNKMREYIATSLDGWIVMRYNESAEEKSVSNEERSYHSDSEDSHVSMDRRNYNCGLEIKTPSSKKIIQDTVKKALDLHGPFSQCEFGTDAFKQLVYKPEYRTQVLHHAVVANLKYVLFVVAGTTKVHYAVLIRFPDDKLTVMRGILTGVYHRSLKWAYTTAWTSNDPASVMPSFREDLISSKSYPITKDCVVFSWCMWKQLFLMVRNTMLALPKAHKIIPEIVSRWNRSKGRVDEMTRYLDGMNFPFAKGSPKQQLVMREFKKMAVNVRFVLKHCYPPKTIPSGKGYSAIQQHHKHMKTSMKDILFELATSFKLMNPVRGVVPGSPFNTREAVANLPDRIDARIASEQSRWAKEATAYVKERITPDSRYKLKKFIDDKKLNQIRLDKTLFHYPKSHGSYVDAKTGRRTIRGCKAKERIASTNENADSEDDSGAKLTKIRKCPPRCIVCCAINDRKSKDTKITQTTIHCSICLVSLCTKRIANRKTTCFERFHQIQDLSDLQGNKSPPSAKTSASKKRKTADNIDE
jgi:hypothetical protein